MFVFRAIVPARIATSCASRLRGRHEHRLCARQELAERDGDVAGAGRHVHEERVELAPVDVREELLERAVEHRPAPHDGRVVLEEEADRHELEVPANGRHDHLVDDDRALADAEHVRDRMAVDVRVEDPRTVAEGRERGGQVRRQGRLADAALSARDREDARALVERDPFVRSLTPPRSFSVSADFSSGLMTSKSSWTDWTPSSGATQRCTCSSKLARSGQPATVSAIVMVTAPPSMRTSRTMSSSVTGRRSSGSITCSRAL